jgi:light-regulated signal transduction histidine kinase (bacteriophytochrome)
MNNSTQIAACDYSVRKSELETRLRDHKRRRAGTIRERAEARRRTAERIAQLEAANRDLQAFSDSVSHDLRAPLRAIDNFSKILLEDYGNTLDAEGQHYLQRVRTATSHMQQLIDDLLDLSRATHREIWLQAVDLSALASRVAAQLRKTEPGRQVEFVIEPGLTVQGDIRLLHVALENLLGNAWKYTAKHARARIEFGRVFDLRLPIFDSRSTGEIEDPKSKIKNPVFFVRDDGAGFDMAYADKLFGAFQRLHGEAEFEGTGIGLTTVQRIIHRHGGDIWAEAAVERGATFYFTLPAAGPPETQ